MKPDKKPELEPCPRCRFPRVWHGSFSAKKADELVPPWVRHIYVCRCVSVTILVLYSDGRRELLDTGARNLSDFLD